MKRPIILPYSRTSISAKAISRYFKTLRPFPNKNYKPRPDDVVINWGFNGDIPVLKNTNIVVLNKPRKIKNASSKIDCLQLLHNDGVPVPQFATNMQEARKLFDNTPMVYCRTLTKASKGKGIVLAKNSDELVSAPLYTAQLDNTIEYRVHIFDGEVIDIVQKRKMRKERREDKGIGGVDMNVRNLMNGWSFTRGDLTLKDENGEYYYALIDIALEAFKTLEIDFCAIDIIKDSHDDFYVLEVNTAPGMTPGTTTHRRYSEAIAKYCGIPFSDSDFTKRYDIQNNHDKNLTTFLKTYNDE